jgi:3-dehydroquinate synthetase
VAKQRYHLSEKLESLILQKLLLPSLKIKLKKQFFTADKIIGAMKKDKKRTGQGLALIMMTNNYKFIKVTDISINEAKNALESLITLLNIAD